ncbi:MAG TPA: carbon-nitrogen hydrolase family protein [Bryobacteraceae bacterium]|nr:carbon-nitrogen hydrolase family protein [Bryobacteraceae bacterium]HPT29139.1 carbon-nitrogen hydrolase family protein [Bryobacteraceae bacterium]
MRLATLALLSVCAIGAPLDGDSRWTTWSPRPEIAPKTSRTGGALVVEGGGNAGVCGGWVMDAPDVKPGTWYRLEARYKSQGFTHEPSQLFARLDWRGKDGRRTGQPEYGYQLKAEGAHTRLTIEAPSPEGAVSVQIQLWIWKAPTGKVSWDQVKLETIGEPAARLVKVASIRLRPKGEDPVAKFIELTRKSVPAGTDIILLPEGITVVGTGKQIFDVAEPIPGPTTERLGALAREKKAWIVAGIYEREGHLVYNTAVLVDRAGKYVGKYRKVYIPREEMEGGITPGDSYPAFQTDFGTVGMMICYDVFFTDPARGLATNGAELILMPIWGGKETLGRARAEENHVFMATSGYDYPAMIYDPVGETLARTEVNGTVALTTIDLAKRYDERWLGNMRARFFRELRTDVDPDTRTK